MPKNTSITLGEHYNNFIQSEISTGRYSNPSEVVISALKLLQKEKEKIANLNRELTIGEKSGLPLPFDNESFKTSMRDKLELDA